MTIRNLIGFVATAVIFIVAIVLGRMLWVHYMDEPWTRDARVRAEIVNVAPDVSGAVVDLPVKDNQLVKKGDLLMQIDPSHYEIAVEQAQAAVAARKAELQMKRDDARRRADMDSLVVSKESQENAAHTASAAEAAYQQALAALDAAKLNLARTRVVSPVDGYVTNLNVFRGDYATAGAAKLAIVDSHSFWVYGYFEETKLPHVRIGDKAEVRLMSGGTLQGHVESISRGIYDRDNPQSRELLADVNPTFNWVRLAQRVPVRVKIDSVPDGVMLAAGITCTVVVKES
ncbi:efflux RND transporter periplasmic adaptor subunit [Paraburkholderia phenoliruptrix]|uniref:Efflux RND transporter periplasmic adaptor subunit n=2 Tax=Paraburkholderia phenoliruptrix TaxID=252970 RepID=A0A6J5K6D0_9BURK|nr:HlyD family secretion protein [Paraburkholderia phenoliruptrix]AFT86591.1 secretion protein HlyD family protein [Paraburkholderia phenoliruptrix BR3459a]MDR6389359.1 RND family efflux transporter MFP subunit [Paraburkholderia phenoliruptrix]MDR6419569.1 RND family efflux transporter MFP subunit [Paraburkholderia phenoliruptrix]WMY09303.1 HlyD family secretion protein [Paraburkholderia phenoliruptrix]CAB3691757.1 p-hydroxybenzoic acid efflux pump subunit AaeA [Paraburkholderia phenoliruptrix